MSRHSVQPSFNSFTEVPLNGPEDPFVVDIEEDEEDVEVELAGETRRCAERTGAAFTLFLKALRFARRFDMAGFMPHLKTSQIYESGYSCYFFKTENLAQAEITNDADVFTRSIIQDIMIRIQIRDIGIWEMIHDCSYTLFGDEWRFQTSNEMGLTFVFQAFGVWPCGNFFNDHMLHFMDWVEELNVICVKVDG
ncbi:hypothetical protein WICPIJ_003166 [Wickerhamomyces pijperi]|uniref:Uncharacterized protein n=1 Tax=Wickerhamomyces pijperi TaxID=599730 RepID=A0A9P8Q7M4_WICPI|nr:hypothetical protein WICPIJ_003166 [Wickerhamomyces pijperi]